MHEAFLCVIDRLGLQGGAVPTTILAQLQDNGAYPTLTRSNVASHLQKYRAYLKKLGGFAPSLKVDFAELDRVHKLARSATGMGAGAAGHNVQSPGGTEGADEDEEEDDETGAGAGATTAATDFYSDPLVFPAPGGGAPMLSPQTFDFPQSHGAPFSGFPAHSSLTALPRSPPPLSPFFAASEPAGPVPSAPGAAVGAGHGNATQVAQLPFGLPPQYALNFAATATGTAMPLPGPGPVPEPQRTPPISLQLGLGVQRPAAALYDVGLGLPRDRTRDHRYRDRGGRDRSSRPSYEAETMAVPVRLTTLTSLAHGPSATPPPAGSGPEGTAADAAGADLDMDLGSALGLGLDMSLLEGWDPSMDLPSLPSGFSLGVGSESAGRHVQVTPTGGAGDRRVAGGGGSGSGSGGAAGARRAPDPPPQAADPPAQVLRRQPAPAVSTPLALESDPPGADGKREPEEIELQAALAAAAWGPGSGAGARPHDDHVGLDQI